MKVMGVSVEPSSRTPVVLLQDEADESVTLPIWVGVLEANAVATGLEKVNLARPLTHDLLKSVLDLFGIRLVRVEVHDLRENTFYAALHLERGGESVVVDSRPSDAIAVALRMDAPILVKEAVLRKAEKGSVAGRDPLSELLENMSPEDFGKYKM
jgi:bifunctional DNase/RNase